MAALLFRLHRWIGLGAALFLCLIGLTGSFLVFHDGIDRLLRPGAYRVVPGAEKLPLDALVGRAGEAWPDSEVIAVSVEEWDRPDAALLLRLHRGSDYLTASLDPYTGKPLGLDIDRVTHWVLRLHDGLLLDDRGRAAFFFVGVALVLLGITGLVACRGKWGALVRLPRWGVPRTGWSDLHVTVGLYAVLFNTMMGFTGAWMNFYFVAKGFHPRPPMAVSYRPPELPLERALESARQALPGLEPSGIFFPAAPGAPLRVFGDVPGTWFSNRYSNIVAVDAVSGAVRQVKAFRSLRGAEKVQALVVPLHFGDFGGTAVRIAYVVAGLTPTILAISGTALWLARRRAGAAR